MMILQFAMGFAIGLAIGYAAVGVIIWLCQ